MKNRKLLLSSSFISLMVLSFLTLTFSVRAYSVWTDPINDIKCFTDEQWAQYEEIFDEPESPREVYEILRLVWNEGQTSDGPNCIDMIRITLSESGGNYHLTVIVQGVITDCDRVNILIWGDCAGDGFTLIGVIMEGSGGHSGAFYYQDSEVNTTGSINLGSNSFDMTFPKIDETDCSFYVLLTTGHCGDVFPNSAFNQDDETDGTSETDETTTDATDSSSTDETCTTCNSNSNTPLTTNQIAGLLALFILILLIILVLLFARNRASK